MTSGLILFSLLSLLMVLGFAYIVWILAKKEAGWINTAGQVIACVLAVVAVIIFIVSLTYSGSMMRGMCGMTGPSMKGMDREKMMDVMKGRQGEMPKMHKRDTR
jgi:bacteriorhodopsin